MGGLDQPDRPTPTLRDVAAAAGVSYQTVSRFLNRPETVSADTAQRVRGAVTELGYVPNEAARALRLGRGSFPAGAAQAS